MFTKMRLNTTVRFDCQNCRKMAFSCEFLPVFCAFLHGSVRFLQADLRQVCCFFLPSGCKTTKNLSDSLSKRFLLSISALLLFYIVIPYVFALHSLARCKRLSGSEFSFIFSSFRSAHFLIAIGTNYLTFSLLATTFWRRRLWKRLHKKCRLLGKLPTLGAKYSTQNRQKETLPLP